MPQLNTCQFYHCVNRWETVYLKGFSREAVWRLTSCQTPGRHPWASRGRACSRRWDHGGNRWGCNHSPHTGPECASGTCSQQQINRSHHLINVFEAIQIRIYVHYKCITIYLYITVQPKTCIIFWAVEFYGGDCDGDKNQDYDRNSKAKNIYEGNALLYWYCIDTDWSSLLWSILKTCTFYN